MTDRLKTIDQVVEENGGSIRAASVAIGEEYNSFYRWYKRHVYAPNNSRTRDALREKGIELPRRPEGRTR